LSQSSEGYVPTVYKLLIRRSPRHEIFDYLWWLETVHMGLCGDRQATERVAARLPELPDEVSDHRLTD
jgi:hypothetical protein